MAQRDLSNIVIGCLKIIKPGTNRIMRNGARRPTWHVKCGACEAEFKMVVGTLMRHGNSPENCHKCKPKFKYARNPNGFLDRKEKIHLRS